MDFKSGEFGSRESGRRATRYALRLLPQSDGPGARRRSTRSAFPRERRAPAGCDASSPAGTADLFRRREWFGETRWPSGPGRSGSNQGIVGLRGFGSSGGFLGGCEARHHTPAEAPHGSGKAPAPRAFRLAGSLSKGLWRMRNLLRPCGPREAPQVGPARVELFSCRSERSPVSGQNWLSEGGPEPVPGCRAGHGFAVPDDELAPHEDV